MSDKRAAILDAAIRCVSKYGVEKASTPAIARELGIAQSGVFYHFDDQQELFDSMLAHIAAHNHRLVEEHRRKKQPANSLEDLFVYFEGNLRWASLHPEQVGVLLHSYMKTSYSKTMRKAVRETMIVGENTVYTLLAAAVGEGIVPAPADLRQTAKFLHQALAGAIIAFHYSRPAESYPQVHHRLVEQSRLLLASRRSGVTR